MTTLILPKFGIGSPWSNGFTPKLAVTKPGVTTYYNSNSYNNWTTTAADGGGSVVANTILEYIGNSAMLLAHRGPRPSNMPLFGGLQDYFLQNADGVRKNTQLSDALGKPIQMYYGWVAKATFCWEFEFLSGASAELAHLLNCNYDSGSVWFGPITKAFTLSGHSYQLVTYGLRNSAQAQDAFPGSSIYPQTTFTWVPYEASLNVAGANPCGIRTPPGLPVGGNPSQADTREIYLSPTVRGGTLYQNSSAAATVDQVQSWIISDLVESEEFASSVTSRAAAALGAEVGVADAPVVGLFNGSPIAIPGFTPTKLGRSAALRIPYKVPGGVTNGYIAGTTTTNNVVTPYVRVQLLDRFGEMVGHTFSDASGAYRFDGLDPALEYMVVAHDPSRTYNASVQDIVKPTT